MATRKEDKERLRAEREAREAEAAGAQRRRQRIWLVGGVLAVAAVVAIVVVAVLPMGGPDAGEPGVTGATPTGFGALGELPDGPVPPLGETDLKKAAAAADCELREDPDEGSKHLASLTETVDYEANPATSGSHFVQATEDGSYTAAPQVEPSVHALEHGRINLQWSPDASVEAKAMIGGVFNEDSYHMQAFENQTEMPYEVAATAWNQAITCESYNDNIPDALRAFRETYRDQGPEFVP